MSNAYNGFLIRGLMLLAMIGFKQGAQAADFEWCTEARYEHDKALITENSTLSLGLGLAPSSCSCSAR
jgi:hypothetical protein